jgi:molybdenum cofactor cytidylyltransferase
MNLAQALRLQAAPCLALVGAGGKTTALFQIARQLPPPVIVTATTHLASAQLSQADQHFVVRTVGDILRLEKEILDGVSVLTGGEADQSRTSGLDMLTLDGVRSFCTTHKIPLLIEADGSRQKPVKAPAEHEPAIPDFVPLVAVVVGLSAVGKPLSAEWVHRPERFAALAGVEPGAEITGDSLVKVLLHAQGGLKNIPVGTRRAALLNQADSEDLRQVAHQMAGPHRLLSGYDSVIVSALGGPQARVFAAYEPVAGIILAAGKASRYKRDSSTSPKQLLIWGGETFISRVARTALTAGLSPVIVVLGAYAEQIQASLEGLPVECILNHAWENGQSTSIRVGLESLPERSRAAVFLLADQPQVPPELIRALVETHAAELPAITAPIVGGRRANPVLFDRMTFPDLLKLKGDIGGRALFTEGSGYTPAWVPWDDLRLLLDVDTPEDYRSLLDWQDNGT